MLKVNAIGDNCPIPVIKTKKAMQEVNGKETIEVLVDNEIAVQNVTKMASSAGAKVTSEKTAEKEFKITILMNGANESEEETVCVPDQRENTVIVINSDRMGNGNDELGEVLMKGFIYTLTESKPYPKSILLVNSGVKLSTENYDTIGNLKILEEAGVEILSCGTCLDYYGLKESLKVGSVTNMYTIVDTMKNSSQTISI